MIKNLQIRNPRVIEVVGEEVDAGGGRNFTEAAEALILEGAERRRISRTPQANNGSSGGAEQGRHVKSTTVPPEESITK